MTGFGSGACATEHIAVRVEASSVNRKQGEVHLFMPRNLAELEPRLRKHVLGRITRGRVNINISLEYLGGPEEGIRIDMAKARSLQSAFKQLSEGLGQELSPQAADYLRVPDIFVFSEGSQLEETLDALLPALDEALDNLIQMRTEEGSDLREELARILTILEELTGEIEERAPSIITGHRQNLLSRLGDAGLEIDLQDERVLKEIALFADRCEITEELTRLRSHFRKFQSYFEVSEVVGRSMDFLCQEINREFNTIGSKANNAAVAQAVVAAKTELEKIREQVQTIE